MQLKNSCKRGERRKKMSKLDKAKKRLREEPRDYTYSEARYLLNQLGFAE